MKNLLFKTIILILLIYGCSDDDDSKQQLTELPDISIVDISQESDWDYWVVGKKDDYYIKKNPNTNLPKEVLFHSYEENKNFSILFTENGLIDKVIFDGIILIFRNFSGNKVDLGVIYPDGSIETLRELVTPNYNWDNLILNKRSKSNWSDIIRWTARVVSGVPCVLTAASAVSTGGISVPLAYYVCGNYLLSLSLDISSEYELIDGIDEFAEMWGHLSNFKNCAAGQLAQGPTGLYSCLSGGLAEYLTEHANNLEEIENRDNDIQLIISALEFGYGDVQITLRWNNNADLDLHVFDPFGEEIFFAHPFSNSGGKLDVDDVDGFGPENIFWSSGEAPTGIYKVYVHYYNGISNSNYTVLINAFGKTRKYEGSLSFDETDHVEDFDALQFGLKSSTLKITSKITKSKKEN